MTVEDTLDGKAYRKGKGPMNPSIYQADERTLIVGTDAMLRKIVAAHAAPAEGKLKTMLGHSGTPDALVVVLVEPLQPMLAGLARAYGPAHGRRRQPGQAGQLCCLPGERLRPDGVDDSDPGDETRRPRSNWKTSSTRRWPCNSKRPRLQSARSVRVATR